MIGPDTGWFEIVGARDKWSPLIQDLLHSICVVQYSCLPFVVFDDWGKLKCTPPHIKWDSYIMRARSISHKSISKYRNGVR